MRDEIANLETKISVPNECREPSDYKRRIEHGGYDVAARLTSGREAGGNVQFGATFIRP